jgi:hypothetical protein
MSEHSAHLETKFVFIDTESFYREKFDWNSKSFVRLKELAQAQHVKLITTSITKSEVKRKIRETLTHATSAIKKYEIPLNQLGISDSLKAVSAPDAVSKLEALFEEFLNNMKAIEVPLSVDVNSLFTDYFQQNPPFSEKKKSEFPDAVVISSLRAWCAKGFRRVYVISGDPDLKSCCDDVLIHADTIGEVISKATVTKQLHDDLLNFLKDSDHLRDELVLSLQGNAVRVFGQGSYGREIEVTGSVYRASELKIFNLNVLSQKGNCFSCEIEFNAWLEMEFEVELGSRSSPSTFEASRSFRDTDTMNFSFVAGIVVIFDNSSPDDAEIESLDFDPEIEVSLRDLDFLRPYR